MTPLIPLSFFSVDPLHILGILFSGQCSSRSLFCSLLLPGFLANLSCSRGGPIHDGEGHTILSAFASPSPVPTKKGIDWFSAFSGTSHLVYAT